MKYHEQGKLAYENGVGYCRYPKQYKANPVAAMEWQGGWKEAEQQEEIESMFDEDAFNEVLNG